jgi:pimeloyl-ACP methyl ester carboxylesterase
VPELADALAAWMQELELPPAVLVGNSLGCQIIAHFALRHPARVTHAVLVGPTMDPKARSLPRAALRLALDLPREPLSFLPVLTRAYFAAGPRRTLRTLQNAFADPLEALIPRITIPTLIVRGARDPIVGQTWSETIQRLLPHGRFVVIPGAAHAVNFNSPDALARSIQSFLLESKQQAALDSSPV